MLYASVTRKGMESAEEIRTRVAKQHLELQAKLVRCEFCTDFTLDLAEHLKKRCKGKESDATR